MYFAISAMLISALSNNVIRRVFCQLYAQPSSSSSLPDGSSA